MTKNRMSDLRDHLFAQIERLGDETLDADKIATEAKRAEAIVAIADQITENAKLQLSAAKLFAEHGADVLPHLPQIGKAESPRE